MKTIRWGMIGCGSVAEVKSGPALYKTEGSELVAVMRRNGDLARDYARRHGVPRWYDRAGDLIADADVNAIYIATPVGTHCEYALAAAAAGKPCYVEKPMARNHSECVRMIEAFQSAGLPLFVAYYRRAMPRFVKVGRLLEAGRLGTLSSIHYRYAEPRHEAIDPADLPWRLRPEHGGGLVMDMGSHTLDLFDHLIGPLEHVAGDAANLASGCPVEDTCAMSFTAAGVPGAAVWNFASQAREDQLTFTGTQGRLCISTFGEEPIELHTAEGVEIFDIPYPEHAQQPLIATIVAQLRGEGRCPSPATSAARTSQVLDTVLSGYYGGRDDAFWTRAASWPGRRV